MPVTALDLIRGAYRLLGKPSESETISAEDADNALFALNEMMDHWTTKRFFVFQIKQDLLAWPGAQVSRTIGPGGDFNIARPIKLEPGCFIRDSVGQDWTLDILDDRDQYDRIWDKDLPITQYARAIYFEPSFPLGTLFLWPAPQDSVTIGLNSRQILQSFSTLTTAISLPQGYQVCIRSNMALTLAPEIIGDKQPPATVIALARDSKASLSTINAPSLVAECETAYIHSSGNRRIYDIRGGLFFH